MVRASTNVRMVEGALLKGCHYRICVPRVSYSCRLLSRRRSKIGR